MLDISFAGAALAGLLSFFTPCILPMVPFYLCYMAGISMTELRDHAGLAPGAQRRLLLSSVFSAAGVTTIFVLLGMDNKSAIDLSYNPEHHARTKHIDRRHYFIRECVEEGRLRVPFVATADNMALTSSL